MELDKMDENGWKYHGEGNKSIVVSHIQHSQVLRFLKYSTEDLEHLHQTSEQALLDIHNIVDFSTHIMRPLLGEINVHHGEPVKLPLDFVKRLALRVDQERPESRTDKVMDRFSGWALCLPNLTKFPDHHREHRPPLCIEIKPKCGFLPFSRQVTKEVKWKVCRFCMHQRLKVSSGVWKRLSKYCPLDLFSGNNQRMHLAIRNLLDEPQNNLKIFRDGELIYGGMDDADQQHDLNKLTQQLRSYFFPTNMLIQDPPSNKAVLNKLSQVIITALLTGRDAESPTHPSRDYVPVGRDQCHASLPLLDCLKAHQSLPKDCVLSKILQVQRLDDLDIEGLYPLYKRVERHLVECPEERTRLQVDGPYNEKFLERMRHCPSEDDGSIEYAVGKVHQYRVAMTAKDCSIMITLTPCEGDEILGSTLEIPHSKPKFRCAVSIVDLDPKPYESIPHIYKLDSQIVNNYVKSMQSEPKQGLPELFLDDKDCTLVFHPI
ncbi:inositol-pentakisphosphate 2-kinase-like [Brienomyrus brachyistius]|uniref:inositol-pentakisphosphate 2-kinase-like n=1 Tax=Brienomyrus brachyistius TaxID=42636 RepID=UPI0020B1D8FC|nr:inositol-pentakisphosphate 2-kinase-like [Brienomyrus brachyistius]